MFLYCIVSTMLSRCTPLLTAGKAKVTQGISVTELRSLLYISFSSILRVEWMDSTSFFILLPEIKIIHSPEWK